MSASVTLPLWQGGAESEVLRAGGPGLFLASGFSLPVKGGQELRWAGGGGGPWKERGGRKWTGDEWTGGVAGLLLPLRPHCRCPSEVNPRGVVGVVGGPPLDTWASWGPPEHLLPPAVLRGWCQAPFPGPPSSVNHGASSLPPC